MTTYQTWKTDTTSSYEFDEEAIKRLGDEYFKAGQIAQALAVFQINVAQFPKSFRVYESYGEALLNNGQQEAAIVNYKKSLAIYPANTSAIDTLPKLGVRNPVQVVPVEERVLASYVGVYELTPTFAMTITQKGTQLFSQATNQGIIELFAKSATEFYQKVAPVEVSFSIKDGRVDRLLVYQNGRERRFKRRQ